MRKAGALRTGTVLALCLAFGIAFAATGGLEVTVRNAAGEPVSGVTVHASTADSLTERSGVTGADGVVRLVGLDPSNRYVVTVSGAGFAEIRDTDVQVVTDRTFSLDYYVGGPGANIEQVVVTGESATRQMVDTTSAMVGTDVTLDLTESLPTGRSYQSYLQLAPTTKPTLNGNPSSKSGVNYRDVVDANGNTAGVSSDNVYYIDGVNITDNLTGTFGANFNSEIIQEQQIITGGVPAEYEGGQGLISRVITKSGSNDFHGSVNYYTQSDSLVADNEHLPNSTFSTFDTAFTLGGPVIRDKLWFFGSLQRKERDDDLTDPNTGQFLRSVNTTQDLGFLKLTWQATGNDQVVAEYFNDPFERDGSNNDTTLNNRDTAIVQGGDNYKFAWTHSWESLVATLDYSSHEGEVSTLAANPEARNDVAFTGVPGITNAQTDLGGSGSNTIDFRNRDEISLTLQQFLDTDSWGYHDIKFGYSRITNERKRNRLFTGDELAQYTSIGLQNSGTTLDEYTGADLTWTGTRDVIFDDYTQIIEGMEASGNFDHFLDVLDSDNSGTISIAELGQAQLDSTAGNPHGMVNVYRTIQAEGAALEFQSKANAFFIQDSWEINDHWTVNAGIRAEEWAHYASTGAKVFTFDYEIAPRLSVVYDINGDGGSKVWAFGGRYYDPIRTNMTAFAGTLAGELLVEQVFIAGEWVTFRERGGSRNPDAVFAPSTKTPYTDEFMVGYERALTDDMSIGITLTDRRTRDLLEDYALDLYTDPEQVGDFLLPLSYFGYDAIPAGNFVIATLAGGKRDYRGAELTFRKRRTAEDRWQLLASYAYNDAEGNSNSDSNADFQGDALFLDPRAPNMYGPQPGNVEHMLKLAGSYAWENGFEVGAVYFWNSGTLYSQTFSAQGRHLPVPGPAFEAGGINMNWIAEGAVGGLKTGSHGTLDLRAKYTMGVFDDRYQAEFFLDIFNALDDQAPIREQDLLGGDGVFDHGEPNAWVEPRRLFLGARLSF